MHFVGGVGVMICSRCLNGHHRYTVRNGFTIFHVQLDGDALCHGTECIPDFHVVPACSLTSRFTNENPPVADLKHERIYVMRVLHGMRFDDPACTRVF